MNLFRSNLPFCFFAMLCLMLVWTSDAVAACVVSTTGSDGEGSLRACIENASVEEITFDAGAFSTNETITLDEAINIQPDVENNTYVRTLKITGPTDATVLITTNNACDALTTTGSTEETRYTLNITIENLTFDTCGTAATSYGGAVSFFPGNSNSPLDGSLTLKNCTFTNNRAENGGAVALQTSFASTVDYTVEDCAFAHNQAIAGAALYGGVNSWETSQTVIIRNSVFSENTGGYSGSGSLNSFSGCIVNLNNNTDTTIENCSFSSNKAYATPSNKTGVYGGILYDSSGNVFKMQNCSFVGNKTCVYGQEETLGGSGTVRLDGKQEGSYITNTTFYNNSCGNGSALYFSGSKITLASVTIYDNPISNVSEYFTEAPLYIEGSYEENPVTLINSVVADSSADYAITLGNTEMNGAPFNAEITLAGGNSISGIYNVDGNGTVDTSGDDPPSSQDVDVTTLKLDTLINVEGSAGVQALLPSANSSLIDAGKTLTSGDIYEATRYDVRGIGRPQGDRWDIGAVEVELPVEPSTTTKAAGNIARTTATLNGLVAPNGAATTVKFYYGETESYGTVVNATPSQLASEASQTAVSAAISGLSEKTTYHYQVWAQSSKGTSTGADMTFTTQGAPDATTNHAGGLTDSSATLKGTVNAYGISTTVTFEYGTSTSYGSNATASQSPVGGSSDTSVSAAVSGLSANTLYHYRVVADNGEETIYGDNMTFTTLGPPSATTGAAGSVTNDSATLNGTVTANGADTTVTFEYGTDTSYGNAISASPSSVTGRDATGVSLNLSSLAENTTYHYRVKAVNSVDTTYGDDMTFTTLGKPTALTNAAGDTTQSSATLKGTVTANGADTTVTFEYGTTTSYGTHVTATPSTVKHSDGATSVSAGISGLTANVTYNYRVVATNSAGTTYGDNMTFETTWKPDATTGPAGSVTKNGATLNGTVNAHDLSTSVVFQYGTSASYGNEINASPSTVTGSAGTAVSATISSGLEGKTTYHYRVKATSAAGTSYGSDMTFKTLGKPDATTNDAGGLTDSGATLKGTVNANGISTTVTFEYGTSNAYGSTINASPSPVTGSTDTAVSAAVSNLEADTTYYYRVVAENSAGATDGGEKTFKTSAKKTLTVTLAGAGTGTVTSDPAGISCDGDGGSCSAGFSSSDSPVTLTAAAADGSEFRGWSLCEGTGPCEVTMSEDTEVEATFIKKNQIPPVAEAGPLQTVTGGRKVTLDGGNSSDQDGTIVGYAWTTDNESVTLSNADAVQASFIAPTSGGAYVFTLTVTDNDGLTDTDQVTINVVTNNNTPPVASAGPEQNVKSGATVTLMGCNSFDPDGSIASYKWTQLSGDSYKLTNTSTPDNGNRTFTPTAKGTYVFQITVTDNNGLTAMDSTVVNVSENQPPVARAYAYIAESGTAEVSLQTLAAGTASTATVTLDGSNSVARGNNNALKSYQWEQISGASVSIDNSASQKTSFSAQSEGAYRFKLTVTDNNGLTGSDTVLINLTADNEAPTADAGDTQNVKPDSGDVTLNGSASTDPEGGELSYAWKQLKGTPVELTNPDKAQATFSAPSAAYAPTGLLFQLTVTDSEGAEDIAEAIVNVTDGSSPNAKADDKTGTPGVIVTLDGCDSTGATLTFAWRQTSGPNVTLDDSDTCSPSFTTPAATAALSRGAALFPSAALASAQTETFPALAALVALTPFAVLTPANAYAAPIVIASTTTYAFELLVTDKNGLMSVAPASVQVSSSPTPDPTPDPDPGPTVSNNILFWRNVENGKVCYWRLNNSGQLKNMANGGGWGFVSETLTMDADWTLAGSLNMNDLHTLFWRNTQSGQVMYWRTNDDGTIINDTEDEGWGLVCDTPVADNWRFVGALHVDGVPVLLWQDEENTRLVYWKLNPNGTLQNTEEKWGRLLPDEPVRGNWSALLASDAGDSPVVFWRNLETNTIAYWRINALDSVTWGMVSDEPVAAYWTLNSEQVLDGTPSLVWYNETKGKLAYWRLCESCSLVNLTEGDGWGFMNPETSYNTDTWSLIGPISLNSSPYLLWFSATSGKVAAWQLRSDGLYESWTLTNPDNSVSEQWKPNDIKQ